MRTAEYRESLLKDDVEKLTALHDATYQALRDVRAENERLKSFEAFLEWREIEPGDACKGCQGSGRMVYSNTSTWHHGIGGQAITSDVCEKCWGSGSSSRRWPSWLKYK
jgi:DnaJ-class molecular chaperone